MARRRRGEPTWPILLVVGVVASGLLLGELLTGDRGAGEPPRTLAEGSALPSNLPLPTPEERIRVEVLNAAGVRGVAGEVRDYLRERGFDVVHFGNAPEFSEAPTLVLDRTGKVGAAEAVAASLGAGFELRPDTTLLVDVTVLVGSNWTARSTLGVRAEEGGSAVEVAGGGPHPWWDLRRFFSESR